MTDTEKKIIELIENNPHLSDDLKRRYILALFLMEEKEQEEYLHLVQAFTYRCQATERGVFVMTEDEKKTVIRTLEEAKKDILNKIHSNN